VLLCLGLGPQYLRLLLLLLVVVVLVLLVLCQALLLWLLPMLLERPRCFVHCWQESLQSGQQPHC
jgi:hypothetical protein